MIILIIKRQFVNGGLKIMPDQVITILTAGDFLSTVSANLDMMAGIFSRYFSGADNLRIVSIILK